MPEAQISELPDTSSSSCNTSNLPPLHLSSSRILPNSIPLSPQSVATYDIAHLERFVPTCLDLNKGFVHRLAQAVVFAGNPPHEHDDYAIVVVELAVQLDHIAQALNEIRELLWEVLRVRLLALLLTLWDSESSSLPSVIQRGIMVYGSPHDFVPNHLVHFLNHDEVAN